MSIIDNLYNLAVALLGGCIITMLVSVLYIVRIIRYAKKEAELIESLEKIKISYIEHKKIFK